MGANNSSLTPLNCILKNWDRFDPQGLKKTHLVFLCDTAWPRYPLEDGKRWPVGGSLKYNTVLQLDQFCKEQYCIGVWNVRSMNQAKLEVVKQEMARVNADILGISELKWSGMGEFNSDDHYIYYCGQESLRRNGVAMMVNKRVRNAVLG